MSEQKPLSTSDLAGVRATPAEPGPPSSETAGRSPLFGQSDRDRFQERWHAIQSGFVDEPRTSVEQADALVAEAMSRLAETFSQERRALEAQWGEGGDVSTEDLRVALQRYRSFFERLLAA
jgi:hypothetical protein